MEPVTASLIAAGIGAASQGANAFAQGKMNKKTREWNEKMYGIQRTDALNDWMRQNEYNSPTAQMQRLRDAGLNPHLVYGGGANSVSQPIRSTDAKSWSPQAPQIDLSGLANTALFRMYDLNLKDAQKNQLEENTKLLKDKQLETQIKTAGIAASTARTNQQIKMSDQLFGYTLEQAKENIRSTKANIESTLTKNEQLKALFEPNLQSAVLAVLHERKKMAKTDAEIRSIDQAIKNAKEDNILKKQSQELQKYEINLNRNGVQKNDNIILRRVAEKVGQFQTMWKKREIDDNMYKDADGKIKFKKPIKWY